MRICIYGVAIGALMFLVKLLYRLLGTVSLRAASLVGVVVWVVLVVSPEDMVALVLRVVFLVA